MYSSSDDDDDDSSHGHRRPRSDVSGGNSNNNDGDRKQRKAAAAAAAATAAAEEEILRQLASLQLPHMGQSIPSRRQHQAPYYPNYPDITGNSSSNNIQQQQHDPPTIRILVVSDIDLASASALAESALTSEELHRVDLCIACGPFCREEDLKPYYQGRQRRRHMARYGHHHHPTLNTNTASSSSTSSASSPYSRMNMIPPMPQHNYGASTSTTTSGPSTNYGNIANDDPGSANYPFKRTKEETAALEGLMTAALSQLESIVCRVIFVPGKTDPMTTICSSSSNGNDDDYFFSNYSSNVAYTKERRLTPNSRNIHQHWMPLCPGLGCTGLLHLDWQKMKQQHPPPLEDGGDLDDDDDDDEDDSDSELPEDSSFSFNNNCDHLGVGEGGGGGENDADDTTNFNASSASLNSPTPPHLTPHSFSVDDDDDDAGILDDDEDETNHEPTEAERAEQYGMEYTDQLEKLIQLAPPVSAVTELPPSPLGGGFQSSHSSIAGLLKTKLFQSILVTHFHHLEKEYTASYGDDNDDDNNNNNNGIIFKSESRDNQQQSRRTTASAPTVSPTTSGGKQYHRRPYPNTPLHTTNHTNTAAKSGMIGTSSTSTETNDDDSSNKPSPPAPPPPPYAERTGEREHQQNEDESFKASSPSSPKFVDDPPWPTDQHEKFCSLPIIQEHVILEIAAGRNSNGSTLPAKEFLQGNLQIILPGSLRERGEFCLVDVAFMKGTGSGVGAGSGVTGTTPMSPMRNHVVHRHPPNRGSAGMEGNSNNDSYRWRVRRTRFHTISDYV